MRIKHPSEALLQSQASERDISEAAESGVEWANDTLMNAYTALETTTSTINPLPDPGNFWLPSSHAEAMMHPDIWLGPIEKELSVMKERKVWEEIDPPSNVCTIRTHWTFTSIYNSNGELVGCKAYLVAKGFTQIPGVDFFETYASVVLYESL